MATFRIFPILATAILFALLLTFAMAYPVGPVDLVDPVNLDNLISSLSEEIRAALKKQDILDAYVPVLLEAASKAGVSLLDYMETMSRASLSGVMQSLQ
jgi:hypothetical protein